MRKRILSIFLFAVLLGTAAGCGRSSDIGKDKAAETALKDAGYTEADITRLHVTEDSDDGVQTYEVEFTAENMEYEYEIQASDGDILSSSYEKMNTQYSMKQQDESQKDANQQKQESSGQPDKTEQNDAGQPAQADTQITIEEASRLALDRVPGSSEKDLKIELDYDDGISKYEGDIVYNQTEYEFEIDANTGNFLEWSEERR